MNTKNLPINPKKIPYHLFLFLLTAGASLILGFLSFGGMYALMPVLPLAFGTFILSVIYEAEIYLQNIKGTLRKLSKIDYLETHLAKDFLLEHFPQDTNAADCPPFFKDYKKQLYLLATFDHKTLTAESRKQKRQVENTLKDMEQWFASQLFPNDNAPEELPPYAQSLKDWLAQKNQGEWQARLNKRRSTFRWVAAFSTLSALFMSLGSTYLIVEAFSVIPWFATIPFASWPLMIVPMAVIAGAAYGLLTYNTVTDLINNDTLNKWYKKLRDDLKSGLSAHNVFMTTMAVILVSIATTLTICTAGTWWTVATNARPLFDWMRKMPSFVMGVINPIITGLSAMSFIFQNTGESMEMLDEATRPKTTNIFQRSYQAVSKAIDHINKTENWLQILNPFRLLLKLTITPLRILLFLGHLISISLTADRVPGIPQVVAMLIGMISEGFEDAHYFFDTEEEHEPHSHGTHECHDTQASLKEHLSAESGHHHGADIPTRLLKAISLPVYALAAAWDYFASQINSSSKGPRTLSWSEAWDKQRGNEKEDNVHLPTDSAQYPSSEWKVEHAISLIKKHEKQHAAGVIFGADIDKHEIDQLKELRAKLRKPEGKSLGEIFSMFAPTKNNTKTCTEEFFEDLPRRVRGASQ